LTPHAAVGGLIEAFEEILDLSFHLCVLHGLGRLVDNPTLGPTDNPMDLPAAPARADQPLAPIDNRSFGTAPSSHLGGIGLDLMAAIEAPHD
jgi:hypothetical protein